MLKTNLSTRPFYNERAVGIAFTCVALLVLALTAFNASRIVSLSRQHTELNARAAQAEIGSRELRASAAQLRRSVNQKELAAISSAAREANALIDRRLFSWTELFNRFEATLPDDVRITSVRPQLDKDGSVTVGLSVVGRRVEDIDRFMDNLEATKAFTGMLSREERVTEEGLLVATLQGRYLPAGVPEAER